jgi:uncharacterized membrane protein
LIGVLAPAPLPRESGGPTGGVEPGAALPRRGLAAVSAVGALAVLLSVAGAIRLNNGLGAAVSVAALGLIAALLLMSMLPRIGHFFVVELGIFLASAALLLLVSLRGRYITGHDIQVEYTVFTGTLDSGHWLATAVPTAYNACLSVTVLPVSVARLTGIPGVYIFKVVLPLLFALAPVLVYRSVRNVAPQLVAVLSAVYFMLFPTFFTDMVYLGRQEVAFVLLGCATIVVSDSGRPLARRRATLVALFAGIVLSHYSTTYVAVATFAVSWALGLLQRPVPWSCRSRSHAPDRTGGRQPTRGFVTWWIVLLGVGMVVTWTGPVTHSEAQARTTLAGTVADLLHPGHGQSGSSETSYSLIGGTTVSPAVRLSQYRLETLSGTSAERSLGQLLPLSIVDKYRTVAVAEPNLPLTAVGRAVQNAGVNVIAANNFVRKSVARLLQVLLLVGLAVTIWAQRSRAVKPDRDQLTLAFGSLAVIAVLTALPQLSVDYGVLRAFQQGLFVFATFIVAGSLWLLRWSGRRSRGVPPACALALVLFLDLTGVAPAIFGGYPPQLQLANAGLYYDIYYTHPEEISAAEWAQARIDELQRLNIATSLQTDRFTFLRLQTEIKAPSAQDIYPTLIAPDSFVLLGTSTVRDDLVTIYYKGDLVTYRYPLELLDSTKNKVYSSEGAEVFQ